MNCFYHSQKEAVGTCKNCGKGVCRDSALEIGSFLACKENAECQTRIQTTNILFRNSLIQNPAAMISFFKLQKYVVAGAILLALGFFVYLFIYFR